MTMELNYKRKLDCIVDNMDVIIADGPEFSFYNNRDDIVRETKKLKMSESSYLPGIVLQGEIIGGGREMRGVEETWPSGMVVEDYRHTGEYEDGDIPTTSEVIHSLRKVMLWMSAQEEKFPSDHVQFLSNVERYALSKQDSLFPQQRKITEFFKHN